ncbi:MAG: hypothetical protein IKC53_09450 [Lentisphaeria bacterium]|nr:hypothetical protein [Lentisphaeria bacterium]
MSWDDYHLNDPTFCTPLPVMRGLVSALCERREAVDSEFHADCTSSGTSAVIESQLAHILSGEWYDQADPRKILFREIRKEYAYDEIWGYSRQLSFMHIFDAFLLHTLEEHNARRFADSMGNTIYDSLETLASALSEFLIVPETVPEDTPYPKIPSDGTFQVCLNAAWASQRTRMLKLLRYVRVANGGFMMCHAYSPADLHSFGASPQAAYEAIPDWSLYETEFGGWYFPLQCHLSYEYTGASDPNKRWMINSAWEPVELTPEHHGCQAASGGRIVFDAVDLRERDEDGNPVEDEYNTYVFDPLCTTVSSGANTLVLSSGVFASWRYGSASGLGGPDTVPGSYIRGWQARNVKVIYDYESNFEFKQRE